MTATPTRKIVRIDEDKCDGCGACVPSCAEGAIRIIDGKARLVGENLCDGLGNCLGTCPRGAITIEERPAEAFDPDAVRAHKESRAPGQSADNGAKLPCGCPGTMARALSPPAGGEAGPAGAGAGASRASRLGHWPVQLALVPAGGEMWRDADVLIAADCVGFAVPDLHERLLAGRALAVACPKLDDAAPQVEKLARIFAENDIRSVTVAHMEVPCCTGIVGAVTEALRRAGRDDIEIADITVAVDGTIKGGDGMLEANRRPGPHDLQKERIRT